MAMSAHAKGTDIPRVLGVASVNEPQCQVEIAAYFVHGTSHMQLQPGELMIRSLTKPWLRCKSRFDFLVLIPTD